MRSTIILSILAAFIISFSILGLSLFLYHYDLEDGKWIPRSDTLEGKEISFYSQHFPENQKKIFLIGSSQIWSLDPNYMRMTLQKNNLDYVIYNLGIAADDPKSRANTVDSIISTKPNLVVYGISDRDFYISGSTTLDENQTDVLPNLHDIIADSLETQLTNYQNNFLFLQSPKLDFLTFIFGNSSDTNKGFSPNPIRYATSFIQIVPPIANDYALEIESERSPLTSMLPLEKNENFITFTEMIGKLQKNKIPIIIFIIPQERHRLEKLQDVERFNLVLKNISEEYPNIPIYSLWNKYADLHIWKDTRHVVKDTRNLSRIYNDDIINVIEAYLSANRNTVESSWNHDEHFPALIPPEEVSTYVQSSPTPSFPVSNDTLLSIWKERKDLQKAYPEAAYGNLTELEAWANTSGWNEDKRLSALIPFGGVPMYLNDTLLSIWKERKDLQETYPEVAQGKLDDLNIWATTSGWNEDKRLSALTPQGEVPMYLYDTLLSIWKERKDLQETYPEAAYGNLTKLQNWATTYGWQEDKRLSALTPPEKISTNTGDKP